MSFPVEFIRSSAWPRAIALALVAISAAGCSVESGRFGEQSARGGQGEVTGSIPPAQSAPVGRVETRPLPQTSQLPPPQSPPHSPPVADGVVAGGGRGMASYAPPYNPPPVTPVAYGPAPTPVAYTPASAPPQAVPPAYTTATYHSVPAPAPTTDVTGSVTAPNSVVRKPAPPGQWSWDGGTAVTVTQGETVDSIARRHGVPASVIIEANHLPSANAIQAGQRLVIPRYAPPLAPPAPAPSHVAIAAPLVAAPAPAPKPAPAAIAAPSLSAPPAAPAPVNGNVVNGNAVNGNVHVVAPGDTLSKIARQYGKSVGEIAKANNIQTSGKLNVGDHITIPGARISNAKPEPEPHVAAPAPVAPPPAKAFASAAPAQSANALTPAPETPVTDASAVKAAAADSTPGFRWPARGRVIAGFGPKPNGQQNDGIDVAVPENTPIKAAEDGVVAYAGNELKGYGNLVLVRHPNGYVTAYAHAKELLVKRGDPIKRGEVIAKSGQTGNVDVPELHFEVRKGTVPVDPMPFLNGV